jgi:hypothetical protein
MALLEISGVIKDDSCKNLKSKIISLSKYAGLITIQEIDLFYLRLLHTYHQSKQYILFKYKSLSEEIKWQSASSQPYI